MKGNRNARKHGLHQAKSILSEWGQTAIDGRSALGRALSAWRADLEADLGGRDSLSTQQHALLDVLIRTKVLLDGVDNYILQQPSLVNRRRKALHPVVRERAALASSFVQHLQVLGLERKSRPVPRLYDYLAQHTPERDSQDETAETPAADANATQAPTSHESDGSESTDLLREDAKKRQGGTGRFGSPSVEGEPCVSGETDEIAARAEPDPVPVFACRCCHTRVEGEPPEDCPNCHAPDLWSQVHDADPKPQVGPSIPGFECLRCGNRVERAKPTYCPGCGTMDFWKEISR